MNRDYFYMSDVEYFDFIVVPRALVVNEHFAKLNGESKILYCMMMDRLKVSIKNKWLDEKGRVYLIYRIEEICQLLNVGNQKATKLIKELTTFDLIEKKKTKSGYNWFYLKKVDFAAFKKNENLENRKDKE
ncbi:replication initiator protein A [Streptobacillus moniliformis]|uniref:replication initiator protein A n=1 Tax=Streptobacillus moniliformis TaxID=34105 RepID=UPI0007E41327|nr:replication initiator protein A [Streptobacillus moniliformis]